MIKYNLDDFKKGWVVGNFEPSLIKTNDFEVAIKKYKSGEFETSHYHKIATEITIVNYGEILMNGQLFKDGDIVFVEQNEIMSFYSITDSSTTVIKTPSVIGDKYEANIT